MECSPSSSTETRTWDSTTSPSRTPTARKWAPSPARPKRREPAQRNQGNRVFAFLRACWAELQRVQWPDRRAVGQATAVVLGFVVVAGSYLGLMDFIWQKVVTALLDL